MGTYRTNKIHVKEAWLIEKFRWVAKRLEWDIILKPTPHTQFEAPIHNHFIWSLGEIHGEVSDGYEINSEEFKEKPLYKVVNREGRAYLLILQLLPDSIVYEGASTGTGLYFETDVIEALYYITYRDSERVYEDTIRVSDINISENVEEFSLDKVVK